MNRNSINNVLESLANPPIEGPRSTLILRLMAGGVFFWEGILKFVYVNQGVGRFTKLGIPFRISAPTSSDASKSSAA